MSVIASLQVTEALKLLVGREQDLHGKLVYFESWGPRLEQFEVGKRDTPCPACDLGHYEFLQGKIGTHGASLCGRDAVQLRVREEREVHLPELAQRLEAIGEVAFNPYMLRLRVDAYELSIFPDGRAIVKGTSDENVARSLYARYIGA